MMNIAFSTDDNYALPTYVAAVSVIKHNVDAKIDFFILTQGLSKENEDLLSSLKKHGNDVSVQILKIEETVFKDFPIRKSDHVSIATYFRLFLPRILEPNVDRILYLDGDLICVDNLNSFYGADISNYALSAVHDERNDDLEIFERLKYDFKNGYFGAGVILINLKYWRENFIQEKCFDYIKNNPTACKWHDQDALNAVLNGKILWADFRYNFTQGFFFRKDDLLISKEYHDEIEEAKKSPCILHFSSNYKPWHHECNHPLKDLYRDFWKEATGKNIALVHKLKDTDLLKWRIKKILNALGIKNYADFRKPE
ncbi:MAG: glycosyltransferase family 8 protein [Treponema sp.]|nr:glycosyltransferase family 8 protein [Treponema sp.]